ncbi:MAG: HlyD family efflux transporter periplasmic adaptor subunit, partial [Clostridia bacterium]|nr:HlyD family efflux transporter periplasmic adaptor subunit [Clostridia bacterium]
MANMPPKKKRRKKWIWLVLILALVGYLAYSFISAGEQAAQAFFTEETVQKRDIVTYYSFSGSLTPMTDEVQTAKESLKVKEVYVSEGELVSEGDVLLRGTDGTRVYAAHTGTIETLYAEEDDTLQPGSQIARIVDYATLEVSIDVDEYDIGAVAPGKEGTVYLNALERSIPGVVSDVSREATREGGVSYYEATLQVDAGSDVRSGMSVEVTILNEQALAVPSLSLDALSYDEYNRPYVFQKDAEGQMTAVSVETGISDGKNIQILSGLSEGDVIYYQGFDMARFFQMQREM